MTRPFFFSLKLLRPIDDKWQVVSMLLSHDGREVFGVPNKTYVVRSYVCRKLTSSWKAFGIPLVASSKFVSGSDIHNLYLKLLRAFLIPSEDSTNDDNNIERTATVELTDMEDATTPGFQGADSANGNEFDTHSDGALELYLTDEKGTIRDSRIAMNEPVASPVLHGKLSVLVCWLDKMVKRYKTHLVSSLPQVFKSEFFTKRPQESVSLYKCLEALLKEEPLGLEDMCFDGYATSRRKMMRTILPLHMQEYIDLLHEFMAAVKQNYGEKVVVQLLEKYGSTHLVFNDDIQVYGNIVVDLVTDCLKSCVVV
ncbi:Ubiquitin carboxyl-terminal hydrolase 8 [Camellia lanceoleosa]|uniref:Ubiquitin carboxyl-terminal hydrolase 8 n=1 Tax=Camellia lanceoleosa TaxID=1840588 RepID=A0ACC0F5N3_9ERIC|nr:Ubiquitin carboxyl-terminal hydrolase 8 [Camellia lanceoleosa]